MKEKYLVSIIIPHYNTPDLLAKLLSTIPDEKGIQTIVIDDQSDEETKAKLLELKNLYSRRDMLFLENDSSEHNAGSARNIGLRHAEGKWLLFADADDYFLPDFFQNIEKYFDSDYDLIFFPPVRENINNREDNKEHSRYGEFVADYVKNPYSDTEAKLRYNWFAPWSKLIRISLVKENHIEFESIPYSNDNMFSVQTGLYADKIAASENEIYCVVRRPGSLTTHLDAEAYDIRVQSLIRVFGILKTNLTKKEFRASGASLYAASQLLLILRRRYGFSCFFKYLKLFSKNKMLKFDIRMFSPAYIVRWIKNCGLEHRIKKEYQSPEK